VIFVRDKDAVSACGFFCTMQQQPRTMANLIRLASSDVVENSFIKKEIDQPCPEGADGDNRSKP